MAQAAERLDEPAEQRNPLQMFAGPWTAQRALAELPVTSIVTIEVYDGSLVVSPRPGMNHQAAVRELCSRLHQAARLVGFGAYPEINLVLGEDLTEPDVTVVNCPGSGKTWVDTSDVVLVAEVMSRYHKHLDRFVRPRRYAAAGILYFMRVEFRNGVPVVLLHELADGKYRPIVVAPGGTMFRMTEPFPFEMDPADLLDA
jgi:hypothetical protein